MQIINSLKVLILFYLYGMYLCTWFVYVPVGTNVWRSEVNAGYLSHLTVFNTASHRTWSLLISKIRWPVSSEMLVPVSPTLISQAGTTSIVFSTGAGV